MKRSHFKGKFTPKNPQKYQGNDKQIIYRSSWERLFMVYCDKKAEIWNWSSEEIKIPYMFEDKNRTYYPDFWVDMMDKNGRRVQKIIEIKPHYQRGGDKPDREVNEKFGQKLDYLTEMRDWFKANKPKRSILVGDLNIAPLPQDVWDHKKMLKIVSHTQVEVKHFNDVMAAGDWIDVTRQDIPEGLLYSWWSYRAKDWDAADKGRRLDHVWATSDISASAHSSRVLRDARGWEKPSDHAPVFATFDL